MTHEPLEDVLWIVQELCAAQLANFPGLQGFMAAGSSLASHLKPKP